MIKRIFAVILCIALSLSSVIFTMAAEAERKAAEAAYGTPVIDGEIDGIWNTTNFYLISDVKGKTEDSYKGWFKVLWDEKNLYVLGKIYSPQCDNTSANAWEHDSMEVFLDENCERTTSYQADDCQIRVGYDSNITGANYDLTKITGKGKKFEQGFIAEIAIPLRTVKPAEELVMGFDIQINSSKTLTLSEMQYVWNMGDGRGHADTSVFGNVVLKKSVSATKLAEPVYVAPNSNTSFGGGVISDGTYELLTDITTKFDDKSFNYPILHINEYPCMEISELAKVIGGSVDGLTLSKGDVSITYTEGSRLAKDKKGHFMLERKPTKYQDRLYVPISSVVPTMLYHMEYYRFDKVIHIITGTNYPQEAKKIVYAKDFGAVGDGVHDDKIPLLKAFHAAIGSGVPSKLVLEENKTYLVSERIDCASFFDADNIHNFTFEGNGSKILMQKPTNGLISLRDCSNIKINNLTVDWVEHNSTQGVITEINMDEEYIVVDLDEGFPLPAPNDWVKTYNPEGWGFGILFDAEEPHLKFIPVDHFMMDRVDLIKDRSYKVTISHSQAGNMKYMATGDRFVIKTAWKAYNFGKAGTDGHIAAINVFKSKDVTFDGVTIYGSDDVGISVGECDGRIIFRNYKMLTKEGALMASNADGLSYWRNRAGLVLENSTMMANSDDHVNTKATASKIQKAESLYTFVGDASLNYEIGDELLFIEPNTNTVLGTAFLKELNGNTVTVDRPIEGVTTKADGVAIPTCIFNVSASGKGSVLRGNYFTNSRRHAYMPKTPNSIFEDNKVINNAGCMIQAQNEIVDAWQEGPFASAFTMRNNIVDSDGITEAYVPVEIRVWNSKIGDIAYHDGILIENNIIDVPAKKGAITIDSVTELYMINNTLICDKELHEGVRPVTIINSSVKLIDGLTLDWKQNVKAVLNFAGCELDTANIKNIEKGTNKAEIYSIE